MGPVDKTYHVNLVGLYLHPETGQWGIGTSEYVYSNMASVIENNAIDSDITMDYSQNSGLIMINNDMPSLLNVYSINGQLLYQKAFTNSLHFNIDYNGMILIHVINDYSFLTKKYISYK